MFDQVAERYDLLNDVLSLGQDRWWRRVVAGVVAARPGERVLDLAAGTGTSSRTFTTAGAYCIACDFSLGMLQVGARNPGNVRFVAGDALRLPFADQVFDAVTISFGQRSGQVPLVEGVERGGAKVPELADHQAAARPGDPVHLGEGRIEVGDVAQPERDRDRVKGLVAEGKPQRVPGYELHGPRRLANSLARADLQHP